MTASYESFGKYVLLEKLATGGMAEIFLARGSGASGVGKFFAIKRILPQFADSPEFKDMFQDEAKIAVNLKHSNVVSINEFGMEKGQFYLVMDYVEGRNLRQILTKMKKTSSNFSIEQIVYVIKEVAAGLEYAHRCPDQSTGKPLNIIHRDMSPQNVMVSFEGEVKIVDFGIAKSENQIETTRAGTLKGKFGYMSPEQAEGQPVDIRTDIFSLGIVLWELLANERLFSANNEISTLKKIRDCQIPSLRRINPNIHSELERIVQKALARDRNLRYQTASALHRDLNRFLNRQYPEFSSQDFSVFVKNVFQDEIMSQRKRLVEYAKVNLNVSLTIPKIENLDNLGGASTNTSSLVVTDDEDRKSKNNRSSEAATRSNSDLLDVPKADVSELTPTNPSHAEAKVKFKLQIADDPSEPEKEKPAAPKTIVLDDNALATAAASVQQAKIRGKVQPRDTKPDAGAPAEPPTQTAPRNAPPEPQPTNPTNTASESVRTESVKIENPAPGGRGRGPHPAVSRPSTNPRIQAPPPDSGGAAKFISLGVFAAACLGVYFYMTTNPTTNTVVAKTPVVPTPRTPAGGDGEPKTPPKPQTDPTPTTTTPNPEVVVAAPTTGDLVLNSNPSGAEIYIDEKPLGIQTPNRIKVPTDRPFSVSIRKRGYEEFKVTNVEYGKLQGPRPRFEPNLVKANIAFLDIEIDPPQDVILYVNGRKVDFEGNALRELEIPGNTNVKVRAENSKTQSFDEITVRVGTDNRRAIKLNPRKNAKAPSR